VEKAMCPRSKVFAVLLRQPNFSIHDCVVYIESIGLYCKAISTGHDDQHLLEDLHVLKLNRDEGN
jgi:hypothetical protein